ncbi:hypothetical protein [Paraburkholderia xenovorans]|uniref:hypothetical protein n=1 Tax=Paraburkholderia xenovorans TaxID=36873 RepID=UPI0015C55BC4|nr:hypothetical protein [Paraburkholderia xenovorans]
MAQPARSPKPECSRKQVCDKLGDKFGDKHRGEHHAAPEQRDVPQREDVRGLNAGRRKQVLRRDRTRISLRHACNGREQRLLAVASTTLMHRVRRRA